MDRRGKGGSGRERKREGERERGREGGREGGRGREGGEGIAILSAELAQLWNVFQ